MTQNRFRFTRHAGQALALLIALPAYAAAAEAGPYNAAGGVAAPSIPNTNFVQLKQISGFTGQLGFGFSDSAYTPVGSSFNKLAKFRLSVNCPANFRVHQAGVRLRGADVHNFDFQLASPGDLPANQSSWEQVYDNEPWGFDSVVSAGATALDAAGNNGPVYVSLDEVLDSRTEFYGWCVPSDPLSTQTAIYYDSAQDNGHLRPKTRVRYTLQYSTVQQPGGPLKLAPGPKAAQIGAPLRRREGAVAEPSAPTAPLAPAATLKIPGGCPYDCPPPAPRRLQRSN
jgi:hypothetical protein